MNDSNHANPDSAAEDPAPNANLRERLHTVVFGTATRAGRAFDVVLIILILASVAAVTLASVPSVRTNYGFVLRGIEWFFTVVFSLEYLVRLWIARGRWAYARSFFGVVDLLAILPTYLSLFFAGAEYLLVIRALRVLRVFRILKLLAYMDSAQVLRGALWNARHKIVVFFFTVGTLVVIFGALMYLIEGEPAGFTSIPAGIYWAVVTLTTVGYGDISPITPLGQAVATLIMLLGYAIIAVPTGIVTAELTRPQVVMRRPGLIRCPHCGAPDRLPTARFCDQCGEPL